MPRKPLDLRARVRRLVTKRLKLAAALCKTEDRDPLVGRLMMTPLDQLRLQATKIARICGRYHVAELSEFGSNARGDACSESDFDLLVTFQPDAAVGLVSFNRLRRALEDELGRRVDLVPKDGLRPIIRDEVLAEAQVLNAA